MSGGHPVAELVRLHDEAKAHAHRLRNAAAWMPEIAGHPLKRTFDAAADFLDRIADLLIDARLVAAAHAQWAEAEEPS